MPFSSPFSGQNIDQSVVRDERPNIMTACKTWNDLDIADRKVRSIILVTKVGLYFY